MNIKQRNELCKKIVSVIKQSETFFLSGHRKPDGDTVASELAMASLLKRMGKKVDVYNYESVPESLLFLPGAKSIKTAKKVNHCYDVAIIFECYDSERMGNIIDLKKQACHVINIDHHLKHSLFGDINFINIQASSNSEQLYYLFEFLKIPILKNEADCLYSGIMADTGRFNHSNTNVETLRIASELVKCGVQVHLLTEKMFGTHSLGALKLLGFSLSNLKLFHDQKIAYILLQQKNYEQTGSTEEDTEEIVNYGLHIPGVFMSILFKENFKNKTVKVSLRSKRHVNVCQLAEKFGGGGHKYASGCTIPGNIKTVLPQFLSLSKLAV